MEELIRRLIREKRAKAENHATPSEAFRRYFGPEHGVELPEPGRYGVVTRGVAGPAAAGSLRPGMPGGIQAAGAGDPEVMLEDIPRHGPGLAGLIGGVVPSNSGYPLSSADYPGILLFAKVQS